jgi:hypothetical protein
MNSAPFKPTAYLREGCPFSFKFLLFLTEAGISERLELIRCNPSSADFAAIKSKLQAGLRKAATFPTVEIAPGRYLSDSDALIEHYASENDIDVGELPALAFYLQTILPQLQRLHEGH